jgi:hypothetical protein
MNGDRFPSVEWFERLGDAMAAEREKYASLGAIDAVVVVSVAHASGRRELFRLPFQGRTCGKVAQLRPPTDLVEGIVIEGPYTTWRDMVASIRKRGSADLSHTLVHLVARDALRVHEATPGSFARVAATLQEFFNEAGHVATRFAA